MAAALSETGTDEGATATVKYANLNEALDQAGSAMGDLRGILPIAFRFSWHQMSVFCEITESGGRRC
jgi:hypothetical protein